MSEPIDDGRVSMTVYLSPAQKRTILAAAGLQSKTGAGFLRDVGTAQAEQLLLDDARTRIERQAEAPC